MPAKQLEFDMAARDALLQGVTLAMPLKLWDRKVATSS